MIQVFRIRSCGSTRLVVSFGRDAGLGVVKVGNVQKDPYVVWGIGHIARLYELNTSNSSINLIHSPIITLVAPLLPFSPQPRKQ